jgi:hypothetical protein
LGNRLLPTKTIPAGLWLLPLKEGKI